MHPQAIGSKRNLISRISKLKIKLATKPDHVNKGLWAQKLAACLQQLAKATAENTPGRSYREKLIEDISRFKRYLKSSPSHRLAGEWRSKIVEYQTKVNSMPVTERKQKARAIRRPRGRPTDQPATADDKRAYHLLRYYANHETEKRKRAQRARASRQKLDDNYLRNLVSKNSGLPIHEVPQHMLADARHRLQKKRKET